MSTRLQPLSVASRDASLDMLRGFALAGVLFVFCVSDIGQATGYSNSVLDEIIAWPKWILFENRMYSMLIVIFGIGFHVQLKKAQEQETSLVPVFTRRLIGLVIIGCIHAILLSTRDILLFYGIAGFALLLVRNASNRLFFVFTLIVFLLLATPVVNMLFRNTWPQAQALVQPNNYTDHVEYNWQFFKLYHQVYVIYIDMLFHFLLGFWISKAGILQQLKTDGKLRRKLLFLTLAISAVLIPFYYYQPVSDYMMGFVQSIDVAWVKFIVFTGLRILWQVWMMACVTLYAILLIKLWIGKGKAWLKPLAAFGQMALSNYLMQSLVLIPYLLVFDRFNNMPPFTGFILFLLVFTLQLVFSTWWMTRYTLGPFEWLLRSITYWKWQPIKKSLITTINLKPFSIQN